MDPMGLACPNLVVTDKVARSGHILPIHFVNEVWTLTSPDNFTMLLLNLLSRGS